MSLFKRLKQVDTEGVFEENKGIAKSSEKYTLIEERIKKTSPEGSICSESMERIFSTNREMLQSNLQLVWGVGPSTEQQLREQGYKKIEDLSSNPRFGADAKILLKLIEMKGIRELRRRGASDAQLMDFFKPCDLAFLDIEATGLYSSQPLFLVGIMYQDGQTQDFIIKQFLANHPGEEQALLVDLVEAVSDFEAIVSYNGKKYDLPYIEGRSVYHGQPYKFKKHSIDLLFQARRKYKESLPNCRLQTLEQEVLGFRRRGDIPGYLIPRAYFDYVKRGNSEVMEQILFHNKLDLISMVKLMRFLMN